MKRIKNAVAVEIDFEQIEEVRRLIKILRKMGVKRTEYRLLSPYSGEWIYRYKTGSMSAI